MLVVVGVYVVIGMCLGVVGVCLFFVALRLLLFVVCDVCCWLVFVLVVVSLWLLLLVCVC